MNCSKSQVSNFCLSNQKIKMRARLTISNVQHMEGEVKKTAVSAKMEELNKGIKDGT